MTVQTEEGELNKTEKVLGEDEIITTGTKVTDGTKHWIIVVKGDSDGDGKVGAGDVAVFKANWLTLRDVEGSYLKAMETDGDGKLTPNDLARMKLYIIKKIDEL